MEDRKAVEIDRQRAEVFDALGHPTRITILKALREGAAGFADLKKKTNIESSGHLQHHLNKLDGLIETDEYGKYCLSDQGKDALLTVQTVENASSTQRTRAEKNQRRFSSALGLKSASLLLAALLVASSAIAIIEYNQIGALQREISRSTEFNLEAMAYYNEFGIIPTTNVNSSFSPPISMYRALQLALQNGGWNKTSLNGMRVSAELRRWAEITDPNVYNHTTPIHIDISVGRALTVPPDDYSPLFREGVVYRYVWQVTVAHSAGIQIPPPGFALVDAATGEIVPNPPLY